MLPLNKLVIGLFSGSYFCLGLFFVIFGSTSTSYAAKLLFASGFEGKILLGPPYSCGRSCFQNITGIDEVTGYSWPPQIWRGTGKLQLLADTPVQPDTTSSYIFNEIQTVIGPQGHLTRTLYSELRKRGGGAAQTPYIVFPSTTAMQGDLYVSYWLKLQPDFLERLGRNSWWALFEWKTNKEHRLITYVYTDSSNMPYWYMHTDDLSAGNSKAFWSITNKRIAVPVDKWFKFEFFWHRSPRDNGRAWQAINGHVVFDRVGSLLGENDPIDRIMLTQIYSGGSLPLYQWVDDIEIWDGFPCGDGVPCAAPQAGSE